MSSMYCLSSLILMAYFFFYFLSSLTSQVRLTVYRLSLIMMVLRMLSSILRNLLVLTTCLIMWSRLLIFYSGDSFDRESRLDERRVEDLESEVAEVAAGWLAMRWLRDWEKA